MRLVLFLGALLLAPAALAQAPDGIDATIELAPTGAPAIESPGRFLQFNGSTPGKEYLFDLRLEGEYATIEVRANGFHLEREEQLVPSLLVPENEYPLFHDFPHERVWEVDGPANVFHVQGSGDAIVLRLGVKGPRNVTLALTPDTTPPGYVIGPRENLTHIGFYQETSTDELALGDMQVRRRGSEEWIQNPTPVFHVRQRFPVQGLDAASEYEMRVVFTDRAGNTATSPIETFATPSAPDLPKPLVRILSPTPNATLPRGTVTIRAQIDSLASPVPSDGVRVFFDKRETTAFEFDGVEVLFTPPGLLEPGLHSVAIEATNAAGGRSDARWTFEIEGLNETALPAWTLALALAVALVLALPRR